MKSATDKKGVEHTEAFKYFRDIVFFQEEKGSPLWLLVEQQNGYSLSGLYHTGIRDDPISAFKVQHMAWCCLNSRRPLGVLAHVSSSMLWPHSMTDATRGSRPGNVLQSGQLHSL